VWSGGSNLAPGLLGSVAGDPDRKNNITFYIEVWVRKEREALLSPSELNAPAVASKRSASCVFKGQNRRFCVLFGGQSRTESSPGALRSALFAALGL
jgi:hypothetical protein